MVDTHYHCDPSERGFMSETDLRATARQLRARLDNYFGNGGFFNPESMEHDKVGLLLRDIAAFLDQSLRLAGRLQQPNSICVPRWHSFCPPSTSCCLGPCDIQL